MGEKTVKKILIIGSSATEYTLAKKMTELEEVAEVFVAPGNLAMKDFCSVVDIREKNIQELLEFALENGIDLTVSTSEEAIKNDIASIFHRAGLMIFAPSAQSAQIASSKSFGKKFMYKNRISCPKFGIFDKLPMALDYISKSSMPIVIKTDEHQEKGVIICNSTSIARTAAEEFFENDEKKIIIEDYILGHEFSFYVITDGYHALPLGSAAVYKSELEGNGGLMTKGMGAIVPDCKISRHLENKIMQHVIYPALNSLSRQNSPYVGILGVDLILAENDRFYTVEFNSTLNSPEAQGVLGLLNENLYNLFQACVIGSFADDYDSLDICNKSAVSLTILSKKKDDIIQGLDNLDDETEVSHFHTVKNKYLEYEAGLGRALVLTRSARVLSRALEDVFEEASVLQFEGMKYRKDIGEIY